VAFAQIGYRDAIRAVLPTDPDWPNDYDAGDIRYSSISWAMSLESTYALGPSTVDPRTGEILNADIVFTDGWIRYYLADFRRRGNVGPMLSSTPRQKQRSASAKPQSLSQQARSKARAAAASAPKFDRSLLQVQASPAPLTAERSRYFDFARLNHTAPEHARAGIHHFHDRVKCQHLRMHTQQDSGDMLLLQYLQHTAAYQQQGPDDSATASIKRAVQDSSIDYWKVPVELIGAGLRDTTMHEVGHTLGLRHNFKATAQVPFDQLHNVEYTRQYGISTSVMDYYPLVCRKYYVISVYTVC
jgi:hypothetical protein